MSYPKYTLTIHIAEGDTPTLDPDLFDGKATAWKGKEDTSAAGHMWYSIREIKEGGDDLVHSYGFAPEDGKSGAGSVAGKVTEDDNKVYHQPLYERTLEISKQQYDKLMEFGRDGVDEKWKHDFNSKYHSLHNSCVDFTWKALEHAGFETDGEQGNLTPRNNRYLVDKKIIDPIANSPLNHTHHGPDAKQVLAGLRRERADSFKENPKAALESFPEYAPLHAANAALDAINEKYAGTRRGDALVKSVHHRLANALERGYSIPGPQKMLNMVRVEMMDLGR